MKGGDGNDTYEVDNAGDVVMEFDDKGYDKVKVSFDYQLSANVERLSLLGSPISREKATTWPTISTAIRATTHYGRFPEDPRPDVSIGTGMGLIARPMRGSGGCQPSGQPER